jgi:predicted outer membrane repeat protein
MSFDLHRAVAEAPEGAVLDLPAGAWAGPLVLRRAVTLRGGPGVRLDGGGDGPLVRVEAPGAEVVLEGLHFARGVAPAGGAVCCLEGRLTLRDCTFEQNGASAQGGGAVYARGERLVVERCRFEQNEARRGGAVLLDGRVEATFLDTLFVANRAERGAALCLDGGASALVSGCTYVGHTTPGPPHECVTFEVADVSARLVVEDSVWAEAVTPPRRAPRVTLLRSIAPPAFVELGGDSLFVAPRFAPGSFALLERSPGASVARPYPARRTLDGAPRGASPGALSPSSGEAPDPTRELLRCRF